MRQSTCSIAVRPGVAALVLGLSAALAGCGGSGGPPLYPVTGKVFVDGKPAANATVVFHPTGATEPDAVKPHATVGADGSFTLTSHKAGDGAPAGDYKVTVEWWQSPVKKAGDPDGPPVNQLASKYAKVETSGLVAQVQNGPTELKAFDLKK